MPRSKNDEPRMDLILWRHAEAEERSDKLPDARRRLTARGEEQARQMAKWLGKRLPKRLHILVSPTERTQMTAHALGLPFEIERQIGPDATATDLLRAAGWPDAGGTVLIVGHQPTLGRVASLLLAGKEADWPVKKGGAWLFCSRTREAAAHAALRAVIGPDLL